LATPLLLAIVGAALAPFLVIGGTDAALTSITGLQAQAQQIADTIAATETRIEILSEEYDQAAAKSAALTAAQGADERAYSAATSLVTRDTATLHNQAVEAYVDAGASSGFGAAFSGSASTLPVQQTYIAAAAGDLDSAIATLHNSEITLHARRVTLETAQSRANANANALAGSRSDAAALAAQLENEEAGVNANLRTAVAAAAAAAETRAQAAAAAEAAAAAQAAQASGGPVGGTVTSIGTNTSPATGSGSGAAAVAAAETQSGVPYVWAGASPGAGFDCSGLTMWAWSRAGVSLPHSAQAQYDSIEHVSSSELEPGDLIFYADGGYIYHVVMYIGGGEVIQALDTGTVIQRGPIPPGAYGYGRP
jgi:cell wall-associated NlpC family hydrolase